VDSSSPNDAQPEVEAIARSMGLGGFGKHVLLCTGPECAPSQVGMSAWDALKSGIKDANLAKECFRTKVGCLRLCKNGPIAVVYPEGIWYHSMDEKAIPELISEHLIGNKIVESKLIGRYPLATSSPTNS
jgi:(2Fe-2S) ferredoxin